MNFKYIIAGLFVIFGLSQSHAYQRKSCEALMGNWRGAGSIKFRNGSLCHYQGTIKMSNLQGIHFDAILNVDTTPGGQCPPMAKIILDGFCDAEHEYFWMYPPSDVPDIFLMADLTEGNKIELDGYAKDATHRGNVENAYIVRE